MRVRRLWRWLARSVLVAIVLVVATFAAYRVFAPTASRRADVSLMEQRYRARDGVNAFPLLWYLRYDIEDDDIAASMANDVAAVGKLLAEGKAANTYVPTAHVLPRPTTDDPALCHMRTVDCLARVMQAAERTREALENSAGMLQKIDRFEKAEILWSAFPANADAPI